ncbi:prephenate dehydrogenase [Flavimobilis soli]|uniref:prephenate dehydrogenase n=1 Tax=Flavimobilis soli TaxID=442709 RepID=UPI001475472E|nr:prephenate dehydrogenase/arogenate dehydrogenase family protein [Flavimobilis soli]
MTAAAVTGATVRRVGVVSLGLIGGSVARRLVAEGVEVHAWNPSAPALEAAERDGVVPHASIASLCAAEPDVLLLAPPLRAMADVIGEVAAHVRGATVVTDAGSVKVAVTDAARGAGLSARFVGAHPMAGTEQAGYEASDARILDGARWALTVEPDTDRDAFLRVAALVTGPLGGVVRVATPAVHDAAVALVSHVPHVFATDLLGLVGGADVRDLALALAAGSFRDGTRVAGTHPRRTEAMVVDNAAAVVPVLRRAVADLTALADALEAGEPVGEFFDAAAEVRASMRLAAPEDPAATVTLDGDGWREELLDATRTGLVVGADTATVSVRVTHAPA